MIQLMLSSTILLLENVKTNQQNMRLFIGYETQHSTISNTETRFPLFVFRKETPGKVSGDDFFFEVGGFKFVGGQYSRSQL